MFHETVSLKGPTSPGNSWEKDPYDREMLKYHMHDGSKTAKQILAAIEACESGLTELNSFNFSLSVNFESVFAKIARALRIESSVCLFTAFDRYFLVTAIEMCLNEGAKDDLDLNARICYMHLNMKNIKPTIEFIDKSLKKYPKTYEMLLLRGSLYGYLGEYQNSLNDFEVLLNENSDDYEIIYDRAVALRLLGKNDEAIQSYESFISKGL